ncbi:MAG: monovalent cation:proton antiporter-2 (CPA2) family protein [Alphaproteobacteria bacterium]|nr:monovalent cation:proton antiporter-2 (CPA2) family protein [Alphaproteobacteria bacterium]
MTATDDIPNLREAVVFLVATLAIVPLFLRLRASPVLGYLAVGALIGPYGLGRLAEDHPWLGYVAIADVKRVAHVAELGVVFLMFMIGLELSGTRLWQMRRAVFGLGTAQMVASAAVVGLVAAAWGHAPSTAVILGAALAMSSTAVVMQLLTERGEIATRLGRTCVAILLFQDLAVAPILVLAGIAGSDSGRGLPAELGFALLKTAAVVVVIVLAGRFALRPLFHRVARLRSQQMFVALTLLAAIGTAWASGWLGLSMALGALLAGLALAETEFRHQIETEISSIKDLLLGLFFISVGMGMDLAVVAEAWTWLASSVVGLFAIKAAIIVALCLAFGLPAHVALPAGMLLGQAGEFGFVVIGLAIGSGAVPAPVGQFMLLVIALTMAVTPLAALLARRIEDLLRARDGARELGPDAAEIGELEGHVIIAGFGRVGRMVARFLDAQEIDYVALDLDATSVAFCRARGLPVYYGDAGRAELLKRVASDRATALVLTVDDPAVAGRVLQQVRRDWPSLKVYARSRDAPHSRELLAMGASEVVPETVEASLQLAGRVLEGVGVPDDAVDDLIDRMRQRELDLIRSEDERRRG